MGRDTEFQFHPGCLQFERVIWPLGESITKGGVGQAYSFGSCENMTNVQRSKTGWDSLRGASA